MQIYKKLLSRCLRTLHTFAFDFKNSKMRILSFLLLFVLTISSCKSPESKTFKIGKDSFLLNGKPYVIRSGEMHFMRIPEAYWEHRLKMAKAMGLNTVCAYMFWNAHEEKPGEFDFTGRRDVAKFCRLAQQEGLYVILRPGPYSCAEWEFGGFPWWLLKKEDIQVRTRDPYYMDRAKKYLFEVGKQLAPLQITKGGPILMVQVENEYGSYGSDTLYVAEIRDALLQAGFEVPLFACDGPSQMKNDKLTGLFSVVNFGGNPEPAFAALRKLQKTGPLMCGEYYPGWFDSWGKPHHTGNTEKITEELKWMLDHKASFSIYMAHGGTSFGLWSGANCPPFLPQCSSYDYDAPISEAGWETEKFDAIRDLFSNYLQEGEAIPEIPARNSVITIPEFELKEVAPVFDNLPEGVKDESPKNMEMYDQGYGCINYSTILKPSTETLELHIDEVHDFAVVLLDGEKTGVIDRRRTNNIVELPPHSQEARLDIFVEAMGRVNYGGYIHDRKGITHKVEILKNGTPAGELKNWTIYNIPLSSDKAPENLTFSENIKNDGLPAFYKGYFSLEETGDCFLDVSKWGKGVVWINGYGLGRFWNIGPTQTMYLPGPWLKKGENEIIILDITGPEKPVIRGLAEPVLNVLHVPKVVKHKKAGQKIDLSVVKPVYEGSFGAGKEWQKVNFPEKSGRFLCLEALDSQKDDPFTTIAELYLLNDKGKRLSRKKWKVIFADSEEIESDDGNANNVFDMQPTTFWHTEWMNQLPPHPHYLVIDIGDIQTVYGMEYLPRQDSPNGRLKNVRIYIEKTLFKGI